MVDVGIINPLHEIETLLGSIETWPSKIIKLIFIDYNRKNVFQISFFYGNKVPVNVALPFTQCATDIIVFWLIVTSRCCIICGI